jgi:hypothetical protein
MKNKKVLILTGCQDDLKNGYDGSYHEVLDLTLKSKINYAQKYNYDFLILRSFKEDKENILKRNDNHIGFLRVLEVFKMLQYYDIVMWLDGDALITNNDISIDKFGINDEQFLYISWDWMNKNLGYQSFSEYKHYFSAGNFIFNKTPMLENFIKYFYEHASYFPEEQMLMNTIYSETEFKKNISILDHSFLNGVPEFVYDYDEWKDLKNRTGYSIKNPWKKNYFLAHICGLNNKNRIKLIKQNFKEFI